MNRRRPQRMSPGAKAGIAAAILIAGSLLTYGGLRAAGWLDSTAPLARKPSREGRVPVPKSLIGLRAFNKVNREDIYDLQLGDDSYFWLPKEQVEQHPEWITDVDQIIGRVMARDKRADFVFSEKDFLPKGSRTGLAGGVPAGKQGFFLSAEQIPGLRLLKMGDRFDLLASLPEESANTDAEHGLLVGGIKARGNKPIPLNGVRLLVQAGQLIALTTAETMTTQGALELAQSGSRSRSSSNRKDERVAIAIDPEEVVPLTQALGSGLAIHAVARSGQQTSEVDRNDPLAGLISFPAAGRALKAFSPISAADLAEPISGDLRQYYFRPDAVQGGWIGRVDQLLGRVVRRDIDAGYIFSESDFLTPDSLVRDVEAYQELTADDLADASEAELVGRVLRRDLAAGDRVTERDLLPPNVAPGIAAGIPAGHMALSVSDGAVEGLNKLSRGERCYLIASAPFDLRKELGSGVLVADSVAANFGRKAVNRVLATDALVVDRRDAVVTLAVRPAEVAEVAQALALKTPVFSVARSSQVDETLQEVRQAGGIAERELNSDTSPLADVALTEVLIGGKRSVHAYRKSR